MIAERASPAAAAWAGQGAGSGASLLRKARPLASFLVLAFGLSRVGWALLLASDRGWLTLPQPPFAMMILAGFGPLLSGVAASAAGARPGGSYRAGTVRIA